MDHASGKNGFRASENFTQHPSPSISWLSCLSWLHFHSQTLEGVKIIVISFQAIFQIQVQMKRTKFIFHSTISKKKSHRISLALTGSCAYRRRITMTGDAVHWLAKAELCPPWRQGWNKLSLKPWTGCVVQGGSVEESWDTFAGRMVNECCIAKWIFTAQFTPFIRSTFPHTLLPIHMH